MRNALLSSTAIKSRQQHCHCCAGVTPYICRRFPVSCLQNSDTHDRFGLCIWPPQGNGCDTKLGCLCRLGLIVTSASTHVTSQSLAVYTVHNYPCGCFVLGSCFGFSSNLKLKVTRYCKTSIHFKRTTRRFIPGYIIL
jgi:hypothetical protein